MEHLTAPWFAAGPAVALLLYCHDARVTHGMDDTRATRLAHVAGRIASHTYLTLVLCAPGALEVMLRAHVAAMCTTGHLRVLARRGDEYIVCGPFATDLLSGPVHRYRAVTCVEPFLTGREEFRCVVVGANVLVQEERQEARTVAHLRALASGDLDVAAIRAAVERAHATPALGAILARPAIPES
jgi:hypothetical protein